MQSNKNEINDRPAVAAAMFSSAMRFIASISAISCSFFSRSADGRIDGARAQQVRSISCATFDYRSLTRVPASLCVALRSLATASSRAKVIVVSALFTVCSWWCQTTTPIERTSGNLIAQDTNEITSDRKRMLTHVGNEFGVQRVRFALRFVGSRLERQYCVSVQTNTN
jgi:hypothetical protein